MKIAMLACVAVAVGHAAEAQRKLTVYLQVQNDRHLLAPPAQMMAERIFANAGVDLQWKSWKHAAESTAPPIMIELAAETPAKSMPGVLGYALPYEGSRVTVFLDRIERMECPSVVLAHVLVHEITHMVQGTARHSETGVMKAHWSGRDLCDMRHRPLSFTPLDLDLIDQGLFARRSASGSQSQTITAAVKNASQLRK